jgi:hypothetical protein
MDCIKLYTKLHMKKYCGMPFEKKSRYAIGTAAALSPSPRHLCRPAVEPERILTKISKSVEYHSKFECIVSLTFVKKKKLIHFF